MENPTESQAVTAPISATEVKEWKRWCPTITECLKQLSVDCITEMQSYSFDGNGVVITAHPGDDYDMLRRRYNTAYDLKYPPLTPEQEEERKRYLAEREARLKQEAREGKAKVKGLTEGLAFAVKADTQAQKVWEDLQAEYRTLEQKLDSEDEDASREARYARRIFEYATEWALLMQGGMGKEEAERAADYDGISGNMYQVSSKILRTCWMWWDE